MRAYQRYAGIDGCAPHPPLPGRLMSLDFARGPYASKLELNLWMKSVGMCIVSLDDIRSMPLHFPIDCADCPTTIDTLYLGL